MKATIIVVEDDASARKLLAACLEPEGHTLVEFGDGESFVAELDTLWPDLVILDLMLPGMSGFEVLERTKAVHPDVPVVMLTGEDQPKNVVRAIRLGASDYLPKPFEPTRVVTTVGTFLEQRRLARRVRELEKETAGSALRGLVGTSAPMLHVFSQMRHVADTDVSVLIRGESGTGKELVARALHEESARSSGPFVAINCAAIPESLQESELFGHERGAFTGATSRRKGKFEEADGGTLFLDEVGELSPALQAKLLRVLQERTFRRLGGSGDIRSDFRLLSATNRDLASAVEDDDFREDLYYRIAVFTLELPPLRERGEDILLLAHSIAREVGMQLRGEPSQIPPETQDVLLRHSWPGNVRELQNVLQRAIVVSPDRTVPPSGLTGLGGEDLPRGGTLSAAATSGPVLGDGAVDEHELWEKRLSGLSLEEVERKAIEAALRRSDGNRTQAAEELGISRTTLYRKLPKE